VGRTASGTVSVGGETRGVIGGTGFLKEGERVNVWGGNETGSWAGETRDEDAGVIGYALSEDL